MQQQELSQLEEEYARSAQQSTGVQLSAPLAGSYQAPMRAELRGPILLLAARRPVHATIDDATVVKGINKALALIRL